MNQTIEIEVTNSVTTKKEIKIPCYRKTAAHNYFVFSPQECVKIHLGYENSRPAISIESAALAFYSEQGEDSTREEFETAYKTATDIINGIAFATE